MTDKTTAAPIDPEKLTAVKLAISAVVGNFTYMGINVGGYITDEELTQVATAAIQAGAAFDAAPSI